MMLHDNLSPFETTQDKGLLLYQAIKDGDKNTVNELLSGFMAPSYSSIRNPAGESKSPIVLAAGHPEPEILINLLEHYKDGIGQNDKGLALRDAAQGGHAAIVTTLLERCENEISLDDKGWALCNAAERGHAAIVTTLLERCENEISLGDKGWALCKAAQNGHAAIVTTLLELYGHIGVYYKGSALLYAAQSGDLGVLNALLADESVLALAASNNNAALRAAQMERNGTDEGSEARVRYNAVIDRLMEIPAVRERAERQANKVEDKQPTIINSTSNRMKRLSSMILRTSKDVLVGSLKLSVKLIAHPAVLMGLTVAATMFSAGAAGALVAKWGIGVTAGSFAFGKAREAFAKSAFGKLSLPNGTSAVVKNDTHQYTLSNDHARSLQQYFDLGKKIEGGWLEYAKSLTWLKTYLPTEKGRYVQAGRHAAKVEAQEVAAKNVAKP